MRGSIDLLLFGEVLMEIVFKERFKVKYKDFFVELFFIRIIFLEI